MSKEQLSDLDKLGFHEARSNRSIKQRISDLKDLVQGLNFDYKGMVLDEIEGLESLLERELTAVESVLNILGTNE